MDRRRRRLFVALLASGALVVGIVMGYVFWWSRPEAFNGVGNGIGTRQEVGDLHPVTFDMAVQKFRADPETVTLDSVRARVVTNTADAEISFTVCTREGDPFASASGDASANCETATAVAGQELRLTEDIAQTIAMTVTPREPGKVLIRGIEVDYARGARHLWQRGSQATGPVVKVRVAAGSDQLD